MKTQDHIMKKTHHKEISTMQTTTRFPRARTTALALLTLTWVTQAWAADTPAPTRPRPRLRRL